MAAARLALPAELAAAGGTCCCLQNLHSARYTLRRQSFRRSQAAGEEHLENFFARSRNKWRGSELFSLGPDFAEVAIFGYGLPYCLI
jgi:hypothetical protein